jgi:protein-S-isoprenylcysteine O-methyltransferase Ste14
MTIDRGKTRSGLLFRALISLAGMLVLLGVMMFVPAGIGWAMGWLFLLVFVALAVTSTVYLWRANPEIFVARSKVHKGTKQWDRVLLVLILGSFFAVFMVAGLDARYQWSSVPVWLTAVGYSWFALGFAMSTCVCAENKFAEPSVRIQADRGQHVVDTGPYAVVRHPLYAVSGVLMTGMPLALGSFWALVPVGVAAAVLAVRTVLEDRTLQNELEGYKEYAARVRYKLIPCVW